MYCNYINILHMSGISKYTTKHCTTLIPIFYIFLDTKRSKFPINT